MFIFINSGFAQSGEKWSFGGNNPTLNDYLGTYTSSPLIIKTDNIERMRILENGNVGIGITAPVYKFQVTGTAGISDILYLGNNLVLDGNVPEITSLSGKIVFGSTDMTTSGKISAGDVYSGGMGSFKYLEVGDKVVLGDGVTMTSPNPSISSSGPLSIQSQSGNGNTILNLTSGSVGIGTTTPNYKLQVNGTAGISKELYIGTSIIINGSTSEINTSTGSLSFGSANLNTTGKITTNGLNVLGFSEFMKVTVQDRIYIGNRIDFTNANPAINTVGKLFIQSESGSGNTILNFKNGSLGIGTDDPLMKVDVVGNVNFRNNLFVSSGNITSKKLFSYSLDATAVNAENIYASKDVKIGTGLVLDGATDQIYTSSGLIDFRNTNLITTGSITASRIETDVFHSDTISFSEINSTGNIITTGDIYARNFFAEKSVSIGNFEFKNGGSDSLPGTKDTIKTQYPIVIKSKANSIRFASDTVIMKDRLAIGKELAEYSLDVAGDARFQDMLIVEDGLIIGKDYRGETGEIDSLRSKEAIIDTVRTDKLKAVEINASDRIDIGSSNTIRIDGTLSQITSTTGLIDFGSTGLKTTGNFTVGNINAQQFNIDTSITNHLLVTKEIKIGTQTMIISSLPDPSGISLNSIYTNSGDLKIQCIPGNTWNTIISYNNIGKVGIGTNTVYAKLHIVGNSEDDPIVLINDSRDPSEIVANNIFQIKKKYPDFHSVYITLPVFTVTDTGNVSIGNIGHTQPIPVQRLEIWGAIKITEAATTSPSAGTIEYSGGKFYGYISNGIRKSLGGQWNESATDPNNIYYSSGNVGIGTNNPTALLHVEGPNPTIKIKNTSSSGCEANIGFSNVNDDFYIYNLPGNFLINAQGNIGIGAIVPLQSSPTEKLEVFNGHNLSMRASTGNSEDAGDIFFKKFDGTIKAKIWSNNSSAKGLFLNCGGLNGSDPVADLTIDETGNVCIGTQTPDAKLTIKGNPGQENVLLVTPYNWVFNANARVCIGDINHYIQATHNVGMTFYDQNKKFTFIGINNESVDFIVDGKIQCNEIEVVLNAVPDYVFEKDYSLPSLDEVKRYINEHKHLPDIPSEKEFKENGMNIGEFNTLLLKKIEELTLYIIKQDEQIELLKKEINSNK